MRLNKRLFPFLLANCIAIIEFSHPSGIFPAVLGVNEPGGEVTAYTGVNLTGPIGTLLA